MLGTSTKSFLTHLPVAHRGLHNASRPENSLAAFRAAADAGYAIETDVRFSRDGTLVLFHDDTLSRLANDPRRPDDCSLHELKSLRLMGTDERIPTFEEFLQTVNGRVPLLIEIKNMPRVNGKRIARAMTDVLQKTHYSGEYAVQSFNPFYVKAYKKLHPEVMCGILSHRDMKLNGKGLVWRIKAFLLSHLKFNAAVKPDFISYGFWGLSQACVTKFKGCKLAWTVRSPEEEAQARKYADNIIFENYLPKK